MKKRITIAFIISFILSLLLFFLIKTLYFSRDPSADGEGFEFICKDCNIILITMTNLRYDHMSSNGYFRPTTPNLDNFAKESLVFDNAFAHSSWTLPESISIYTGLYPYQHGIMNRYDGSKLSPSVVTLIDILNSSGYATAAFTGGFDYNPEFGLTNRFSYHKECPKEEAGQPEQKVMAGPNQYGEFNCTVSHALKWLKTNINNKFFIHVQGFDAHCPFSQKGGKLFDSDYQGTIDYSNCLWTFDRSEPITKDGEIYYPIYTPTTGGKASVLLGKRDIEHLIALYDEGIFFADQQIGLFLREVRDIGLSDNTIIIFTSEHGDMFGKHGRFMRGGPLRGTFYDDVLHIPLIIKHPKIAPKRLDGLVQHIDIMPSFLDLLGLSRSSLRHSGDPDLSGDSRISNGNKRLWTSQSDGTGKSLVPLILQNKEVNSYVFAGSEFNPDKNNPYFFKKTNVNAVRNKQWKLIQETISDSNIPSRTLELYDIVNDKEEINNLRDEKKDVLQDLQSSLNMWLNDTQK